MNKTVLCIIFGGASSEYEISLRSAASVIRNADPERFELVTLSILRDGRQFLYNGDVDKIEDGSFADDLENLYPAVISPCPAHHGLALFNKAEGSFSIKRVDVFFPVVHGENCEDGNLQGLLKLSGVPYIGSDVRGSAVSMDKSITKALLEKTGIPMAKWYLFRREKDLDASVAECEKEIDYPIFVKPCGTGSSVGVSRADDREALVTALENAFRYDTKVLAEETIVGSEIEVAVMDTLENGKRELFVSLPGELVANAEFYDYDTKYKNDTAEYYIPARLSQSQMDEVRAYAKTVFRTLDCRGLSRVDFFITANGFIFNEINTLPGFTSISMYPKLMENMGLSYSELITRLVQYALEENPKG